MFEYTIAVTDKVGHVVATKFLQMPVPIEEVLDFYFENKHTETREVNEDDLFNIHKFLKNFDGNFIKTVWR